MNLRRATELDRELIKQWIDRHACHAISPDFYFQPFTQTEISEDEEGPAVIYRISRALRFDMEFNPNDRARTRKALLEGFQILRDRAKQAGFTEFVFESHSKPLIAFCKRRFGFQESPNELIARF